MKLFFRCIYCGKTNDLPYNNTDRVSLRNECGLAISRHCIKCKKHCSVGVNEVKAKESKLNSFVWLIGFLLSIIIAALVFLKLRKSDFIGALEMLGMTLAIPIFFAAVYSYSEKQAVRLFNRHYV